MSGFGPSSPLVGEVGRGVAPCVSVWLGLGQSRRSARPPTPSRPRKGGGGANDRLRLHPTATCSSARKAAPRGRPFCCVETAIGATASGRSRTAVCAGKAKGRRGRLIRSTPPPPRSPTAPRTTTSRRCCRCDPADHLLLAFNLQRPPAIPSFPRSGGARRSQRDDDPGRLGGSGAGGRRKLSRSGRGVARRQSRRGFQNELWGVDAEAAARRAARWREMEAAATTARLLREGCRARSMNLRNNPTS